MPDLTIGWSYTVTRVHRCDGCGAEAETASRTPLPNKWIRLSERHGKERPLKACSWACVAELATLRASAAADGGGDG